MDISPPPSVQIASSPPDIPPPPKPTSKFIFIIGGLFILIVGLLGGYYLTKSSNSPKKACTMEAKICPDGSSVGRTGPNCEFAPCSQITSSSTPTTSLSIESSQSAIANWKIFEDKYHGFSLKYPQTWQTPLPEEIVSEDGIILQTTNIGFKDRGASNEVKIGAYIVVPYAPHVIAKSLNEVFDKDSSRNRIIDIKDFTLDRQLARKIVQIDEETGNNEVEIAYQYPKPVNGDQYSWIILVSDPQKFETEKVVFDQILSTFKFL